MPEPTQYLLAVSSLLPYLILGAVLILAAGSVYNSFKR